MSIHRRAHCFDATHHGYGAGVLLRDISSADSVPVSGGPRCRTRGDHLERRRGGVGGTTARSRISSGQLALPIVMSNEEPRTPGAAPIDMTRPHPARRYDYWLGGKDNFQADRDAAEAIAAVFPHIRTAARENRAFMRRAVRYLTAEVGVRQFLDIGTGLPT